MALNYRCFRHKETGQVCYAPAGRYGNFLNAIKKLVNYIRYNVPRYYVAHVILTVAENVSDVDFVHLHRTMTFIGQRLKRVGSDFKYVAVKELQDRGAIHYHVLCVYSKAHVFPSSSEIARSWGLGFVKVRAPRVRMKLNAIVGYIGKYIGKGYEYESLETKKSFTASQIRQIYKLSAKRLGLVMEKFGKEKAELFRCTYRKVYEIVEIAPLKGKNLLIEFPSEWAYVGEVSEPF